MASVKEFNHSEGSIRYYLSDLRGRKPLINQNTSCKTILSQVSLHYIQQLNLFLSQLSSKWFTMQLETLFHD